MESNPPVMETNCSWPVVLDLCVAAIALACFFAVVQIAKYWFGHPVPEIVISLSPRALPLYAFYSLVRIGDRKL